MTLSKPPHLYRIILPVSDIERAVDFYAAVLQMPGERISPGRHYFNCRGTILACYDPEQDGDETGSGWNFHASQYIYFAVDDLKDALNRVEKAGGNPEGQIQEMPWGERMFWARDPLGSPISFVDGKTIFHGKSR